MEWIAAGIFSLLIGLVGVWTGFRHLRNRSELNLWKTTNGRVIERGIYQPNVPALGPPAYRHAPLVRYAYEAGGKEFINDSIYPKRIQLPPHASRKWAQKKADAFPDEVVVHYNSADPSEAYLVQTSKVLLVLVIAVSFVMVLFGLLILATKFSA